MCDKEYHTATWLRHTELFTILPRLTVNVLHFLFPKATTLVDNPSQMRQLLYYLRPIRLIFPIRTLRIWTNVCRSCCLPMGVILRNNSVYNPNILLCFYRSKTTTFFLLLSYSSQYKRYKVLVNTMCLNFILLLSCKFNTC